MKEALRVVGTWPSVITLTRGWCVARARPWNDISPQAHLRLERGGAGFLRAATEAVLDLGASDVLSPALHLSSTRIWRRSGYQPAHRLLIMERVLSVSIPAPTRPVLPSLEPSWARIVAIDDAAFAPFWRLGRLGLEEALASTPRSALLVASEGGEIAGYAIVGSRLGASHLQRIAVDPAYAGNGIGADLVRGALLWARPVAPSIDLNVHPDNRSAHRLYLREGFRDTGSYVHILRYEP